MSSKVRLVDVTCKIGSGATPKGGKASYLEEGDYKLVRSQNIYNHYFSKAGLAYISEEQAKKLKNVELQKDDILINITGDSVARTAMVNDEMLPGRVNQHVSIIRCDEEKLNPYYLLAILTSNDMQRYLLSVAQVGGTRAALTKGMLENTEIDLLDMEKQKYIGDILKSINSKIETNKIIVGNLEELAQTLFNRWFIDFEFLTEEGLPYKSSGGKMVDSELGEIPVGWHIGALNDISTIIMGQSPKGDTYNLDEIGFPLINGASDFKGGYIKPNKYTTDPKKISKVGDYIFGVRATLGNVTETDKSYAIGRGVGIARANDEKFKEYIYFQLIKAFNTFEHTASGSVYLNISKNDLNDFKITVPSENVMEAFHLLTTSMLEKKKLLIQENNKLEILRDSFLPKLLLGEIEIPNERYTK